MAAINSQKIVAKELKVMPRKGESIFKRQDGRWEARYIHHYENNKAVYRYLYGKTYSEVKHKRIIEQNMDIKPTKKRANMSFKEVAEEWLETIRNSVKESTYTSNKWLRCRT